MTSLSNSPKANTETAVSYIHSESIASVPEAVRSRVKLCVLDTLGAITAGYQLDETQITTQYVSEVFVDGESTILDGEGEQYQIEGTVLANSIAANALDIDEGHIGADGHPAAITVPTAVAAAEECDATVGELLDAVLVGYEIAVRAGISLPKITGHHTGTGSWGAIGSAAAVARLRNLSFEQTAEALSIAEFNAPQTPILRSVATPGSGMTKDGIGWGGHVGVTAATMAERGLSGSGTIFDEQNSNRLQTLGDEYSITNAYYKPYSCCRWIHPGIDAVRDLYDKYEVDPDNIVEVRVHTFQNAIELQTLRPESADAAEYSYPFAIATALLKQTFTPEDLALTALTDEDTLELAEKITFVHDESVEARYEEAWLAWIEIETADRTYTSEVTHPRGSAKRPLTDSEQYRKQQMLFDPYLGSGTAESLRKLISQEKTDIAELLDYWN